MLKWCQSDAEQMVSEVMCCFNSLITETRVIWILIYFFRHATSEKNLDFVSNITQSIFCSEAGRVNWRLLVKYYILDVGNLSSQALFVFFRQDERISREY